MKALVRLASWWRLATGTEEDIDDRSQVRLSVAAALRAATAFKARHILICSLQGALRLYIDAS